MQNNLNFNELHYFLQVAKTGSFTKAANALGVTTSAMSHSIRNLENSLNVRLLNRTTRSISLTEAGETLLLQIAPHFKAISAGIHQLADCQDHIRGTIRINTSEFAAQQFLYPKLLPLLQNYPQLNIELFVENRWVDIVAQGFDMGVRLGYALAQDMVAVRISDELKMALVAAPGYLQNQPPITQLADLDKHHLIAMRLSSDQAIDNWEFNVDGEKVQYRPTPRFCVSGALRYQAAKDGLGVTWLPQSLVSEDLHKGNLVELLPELAMTYEPLYLYYPNRKGNRAAFKLIVEKLKA